MARVLSLTGARIRELDIESDDNMDRDPQGVSGAVFQGMSYMDLSHCCDAFHGIRKVTMIVDGDCIGGWMTGNLVKILSGATNLEKMCFSGTRISPVSPKYIFGTTTWSHLTSLSFVNVDFDQGELLDLLRRHSGILKDICLFGVCLRNGSWRVLLEGMKSSLSLEAISIDGPCEEGNKGYVIDIYVRPAALTDYLLGDGPHPLR